jgi:CBS-domain-containing membrane protein
MGDEKHVALPVRVRSTLQGSGEEQLARTVRCPDRGTLAVVECQFCAHCDSLMVDREGDISGVVCHPKAATEACDHASRTRLPSEADRTSISEVMTRDVLCVRTDVSVEALTALFLDRKIGALPVVDGDGHPIGVVTKTDLVRYAREGDDLARDEPSPLISADGAELEPDRYQVHDLTRATAHDVMVPFAFTLREEEPLSRAAALMAIEQIHHLPVVAADGQVVGLLSSQDLVRWIARGAGYLR